MKKSKVVGASFSHPHLLHLDFAFNNALEQYSQLGLKHIRLGCYWANMEKTPGIYDFSEIDSLVDACGKLGITITMTVGIKAPRYPEYYIPSWIVSSIKLKNNSFVFENDMFNTALFSFIKATIIHFKNYPQIKYWQIENEPLDPSGPHWWRIDSELLEKEVVLVKDIDSDRPIMINLWGNELSKRNYYDKVTNLADIVGLDLYPKVPNKNILGKLIMQGPRDSDIHIQEVIKAITKKGKKVWISELQAEPWTIPDSCSPQQVMINAEWISDWEIDGVFFWGFEYWYQQKMLGNIKYWTAAEKAIALLTK
ncbi:hypothetical protein A2334_04520 [Candidatus Roizmanbacteria bacterium RIFOXYB2_FULL_38_10]|uniref:Glycoside hydrolase family 42 N-terminal domain-containing protein n=1 Tax=Candidatus Roizmanbacteria bacterium RIFOXYD1_FULL_38_12 TaxID=1802093 RepID=A0A1F7KZI3_9BACT|nr:MAG: hypothetical protein A3K47_00625 [Candidatus Roizmanbacteria bacterium RIFOXYA2_FULL_38_14]OGK63294.1 MAG: hypothetical protein A3K27_00625 [Candidatus Roizmanbacteria bacterium RIFOXYA1_FULL_37_12]OGK65140.1 MAG: hypothetical protein A3K38_00625 [Candidatus Roizmanbacteria bacterium RIFOXYB1_FULL_40_23]OGK68695.1 MAG: hypothetical protein A2334_04520 [Candidatus Roizmanbacteria bacterium RIFOXYB2_FULL_38_10]OGK69544.1 MAG: hypothetical protein A3K21_00625 [Candidatus Roizmanbacteria ba